MTVAGLTKTTARDAAAAAVDVEAVESRRAAGAGAVPPADPGDGVMTRPTPMGVGGGDPSAGMSRGGGRGSDKRRPPPARPAGASTLASAALPGSGGGGGGGGGGGTGGGGGGNGGVVGSSVTVTMTLSLVLSSDARRDAGGGGTGGTGGTGGKGSKGGSRWPGGGGGGGDGASRDRAAGSPGVLADWWLTTSLVAPSSDTVPVLHRARLGSAARRVTKRCANLSSTRACPRQRQPRGIR